METRKAVDRDVHGHAQAREFRAVIVRQQRAGHGSEAARRRRDFHAQKLTFTEPPRGQRVERLARRAALREALRHGQIHHRRRVRGRANRTLRGVEIHARKPLALLRRRDEPRREIQLIRHHEQTARRREITRAIQQTAAHGQMARFARFETHAVIDGVANAVVREGVQVFVENDQPGIHRQPQRRFESRGIAAHSICEHFQRHRFGDQGDGFAQLLHAPDQHRFDQLFEVIARQRFARNRPV